MAISRGFQGRRRGDADPTRLPPGQYLTDDFPVLSAGPTPHTPLAEWDFTIRGAVDERVAWTWDEFLALPSETVTVDVHCVTKWSKLDTVWKGVSLDTLLDGVETSAEYVLAFCDGGYTTNLPARGRHRRQGVGRLRVRRRATRAGARRPGQAARPAPLLLEERQVGARPRATRRRRARLLGDLRLPQLRRPVERAALQRRLTWQLGTVVELVDETGVAAPAQPPRRSAARSSSVVSSAVGKTSRRSSEIGSPLKIERP